MHFETDSLRSIILLKQKTSVDKMLIYYFMPLTMNLNKAFTVCSLYRFSWPIFNIWFEVTQESFSCTVFSVLFY